MAKKTAIENTKIKAARERLDEQSRKLGELLAQAIIAALAATIPEGWILRWHHADDCYNDEDYYFDIRYAVLISVLEPRRGEMIKPAVERKTEMRKDRFGLSHEHVVEWGSDAEYEWHIDAMCKPRATLKELNADDHEGVISLNVGRSGEERGNTLGLAKTAYRAVAQVLDAVSEDDLRKAFGGCATVTVWADGSHEVH